MRDILFRGKAEMDNPLYENNAWKKGEWVYGDYQHFHAYGGKLHAYISEWGIKNGSVIPKTVGQFTGLYDSTKWEDLSTEEQAEFLYSTNGGKRKKEDWQGKPIFEGDIVKTDKFSEPNKQYIVKYDLQFGAFIGQDKYNMYFVTFDGDSDQFKVIGNIHDNPELLGGNEE